MYACTHLRVRVFEEVSCINTKRNIQAFLKHHAHLHGDIHIYTQALKVVAFAHAYFFPVIEGHRTFSFINTFDFVVSVVSVAEVAVNTDDSVGINVLRTFRVLRLLNVLPSLRSLLQTASNAILTVMGCFLVLLIFVLGYAIVGVPLLSHVKFGRHITRNSNFRTTISALIVLFRYNMHTYTHTDTQTHRQTHTGVHYVLLSRQRVFVGEHPFPFVLSGIFSILRAYFNPRKTTTRPAHHHGMYQKFQHNFWLRSTPCGVRRAHVSTCLDL